MRSSARRRGFANTQLLAALGVALLLGLALLAQSGQIGYGIARMLAGKSEPAKAGKAAADKKTKGKGKDAPPAVPSLYPSEVSPLQAAAADFGLRRTHLAQSASWRQSRARRSLARMDEAAAAAILTKLTDPQAADLLRGLDEYALGRVLAAAPPEKSSRWILLLTEQTPPPPLPPELAGNPAALGSLDALDELLRQQGYAPDGSPLPGPGLGLTADPAGEPLSLDQASPDNAIPDDAPPGTADSAGASDPASPDVAGGSASGATPPADPLSDTTTT